jgi:hypothetical protein
MAGDNSLHLAYAPQREYELWTIYYGDDPEIFKRYQEKSDRAWRSKGLKIEHVRKVLLSQLFFKEKFNFQQYDFIFLPDDDIEFPNNEKDISELFNICHQVEADVFQPAILNDNISVAWKPTKLIPGAFCHRTNIVEIMMHGFSGKAFTDAFLPAVHAMQFMRSGWGIEPIWMKIGETIFRRSLRTFVIDAVPAIHTRPLGSGSPEIHQIGMTEARFVPQIKWNRMKTVGVYKDISEVTWP